MPKGAPESPTILITNPSPPRDIVSTSRMPTAIAVPVRNPASATWCGSAKTVLTRRRWAVTSVTAWECAWPAYTIACWAARTSSRESRIGFLYQAMGVKLALASHGSSQAQHESKAGVPCREPRIPTMSLTVRSFRACMRATEQPQTPHNTRRVVREIIRRRGGAGESIRAPPRLWCHLLALSHRVSQLAEMEQIQFRSRAKPRSEPGAKRRLRSRPLLQRNARVLDVKGRNCQPRLSSSGFGAATQCDAYAGRFP